MTDPSATESELAPALATEPSPPGPLVSFVVPVYNPPLDVFEVLLDSLEAQTEPRWECVLVDDASPSQAVRDLLAVRASEEPRFVVALRPANGGISAATNDGIELATAPIVAFTDHDDALHPDAVAELAAHFSNHPDHGLVYTDERLIHADGSPKATYPKPDYSPIRHLGQNYINHITAVRRSAIGDRRIRTEFEPAQDADFVHRVIEGIRANGGTVGHIPKKLYLWRAIDTSSALDAGVKTGMFDSALAVINETIDRRGLDLVASTVSYKDRGTPSVRLDPPPISDDDVELLPIDDRTTPADINAAIAATTKGFLALVPDSHRPHRNTGDADALTTTDGWASIVAADAARDSVIAAGPLLLRTDGHILCVGRTIEIGLDDPYWDHPFGGGPWGAWHVTREVSVLAPEGLVIDVEQARQHGPWPEGARLDSSCAAWCDAANQHGATTIITPRAQLVLDRFQLLDQANDAERLADLAAVARITGRAPVEAYSMTDPIVDRHFPNAWEIIDHLVGLGSVDIVSISLEGGLIGSSTTTTATGAAARLDPAAAALIRGVRAMGAGVCVVSREEATVADAERLIAAAGFDLDLIDTVVVAPVTGGDVYAAAELLLDAWNRVAQQASAPDSVRASFDPHRVAHLGPNHVDDLAAAASVNAIALLLDVAETFRVARRVGSQFETWRAAGGDDGGLADAMRSAMVGAGDLGRSAGYQLGATVLGPLIVGGYADSIEHPALAALIATVNAAPGDPMSNHTAPFDPGTPRSGLQQGARRAIADLAAATSPPGSTSISTSISTSGATPVSTSAWPAFAVSVPWHDDGLRASLVADAIDAVEQPNPLMATVLTLWANGAPPPSTRSTSARSSPAARGETTGSHPASAAGTPTRPAIGTRVGAATRRLRGKLGRRNKSTP